MSQFKTEEILKFSQEDCEREGLTCGPPTEVPKVRLEDFPSVTAASVSIITGFVATHVNVTTTDGHSGAGWAFGIGEGLDLTKGTLGYSSWDVLKSEKNSIVVAADVDALVITFFVNGSLKAAFFGAGVGEDESGGYGHFTWE